METQKKNKNTHLDAPLIPTFPPPPPPPPPPSPPPPQSSRAWKWAGKRVRAAPIIAIVGIKVGFLRVVGRGYLQGDGGKGAWVELA